MMGLEAVLRTVSPHFVNLSERVFAYGPQGKLVLRNLEEYWFAHCVTMPRYNVFPYDGSVADALQTLRQTSMDVTPFAIATLATSKTTWNESLLPAAIGKVTSHRVAKLGVFVDASQSKSLLHKIQRERKVWWRKLAQYPSRFVQAEAKRASRSVDATEIEAQFSFGSVTVETITHHSGIRKLYSQTESFKDAVDVHMIEHVASLDWGCLALFCDSYTSDNSPQPHIHPRLAPYKTTFLVTGRGNETNSDTEDLDQFVLYLNNTLRARGISTILTGSERIAEMCLIPFVVSVDGTSLKNGIVHVKSRSTTLQEAVHITDLVRYIASRSS